VKRLKEGALSYVVFTRARALDHWVSKKEDLFSIGKELLLPELPLKLRLIGLRVTKLKDLRAPESASGIKRFFGSATDNDPRKKAKMEGAYEVDEAMPGYHEFDETDCKALEDESELDGDLFEAEMATLSSRPSRPPHSTGCAISSNVKPDSRPRSRSQITHPTKPTQTCPVCDKNLVMDNADFNAHVDFCLSRGAIMQAQMAASKTAASVEKIGSKPRSFSKRGGNQR